MLVEGCLLNQIFEIDTIRFAKLRDEINGPCKWRYCTALCCIGTGTWRRNSSFLSKDPPSLYCRTTVIRVADPDGISTKASATVAAAGTPVTATKAFASFVFTNVPSGSAGTLSGNAPDTFAIGDVTYAFVSSSLGLSNNSTQVFIDFPDALNLATTTTTVSSTGGDATFGLFDNFMENSKSAPTTTADSAPTDDIEVKKTKKLKKLEKKRKKRMN